MSLTFEIVFYKLLSLHHYLLHFSVELVLFLLLTDKMWHRHGVLCHILNN